MEPTLEVKVYELYGDHAVPLYTRSYNIIEFLHGEATSKHTESEMETWLAGIQRGYRDFATTTQNQMEKRLENEVETRACRDYSARFSKLWAS